jgi:hypothetical protein
MTLLDLVVSNFIGFIHFKKMDKGKRYTFAILDDYAWDVVLNGIVIAFRVWHLLFQK